jgi:hypothetical protein
MQNMGEWSFRQFAALLSELETGLYTGKLVCQAGSQHCELYLKGGLLVHASSEDSTGEDAVYDLLGWSNGTLRLEPGKRAPERSLDDNELALLHETIQLFQSKGKFDMTISPESAVGQPDLLGERVAMAKMNTPKAAVLQMAQTIATALENKAGTTVEEKSSRVVSYLADDIEGQLNQSINMNSFAGNGPMEKSPVTNFPSLPAQWQPSSSGTPIKPGQVSYIGKNIEVMSENLFRHCLPPGRQAEPVLQLNGFQLSEFLGRIIAERPNSYVVINSIDTRGIHEGLLIIEEGKLQAARYAKDNFILKAQSAFVQLENVARNAASEVTVFESEAKVLNSYRVLIGGKYLLSGARAQNLNLNALVREQINQKNTVALRFYSKNAMALYMICQGEVLGTYHLRDKRMVAGGNLAAFVQQPGIRLDVLEVAAAEQISLSPGVPEPLSSDQAALLTDTASCILQFLSTLSGSQKVLAATKRILAEALIFHPCLQRLTVGLYGNKVELSWMLSSKENAPSKAKAEAGFNFLLEALLKEHSDLLGQDTLQHLVRKTLQDHQLDLKKGNLSLACLT